MPVISRSRITSLDRVPQGEALARYLWNRSGPLSSNVAEASAFTHARAGLSSQDDPDIQFHFGPAYFRDHGFRTEPGTTSRWGRCSWTCTAGAA